MTVKLVHYQSPRKYGAGPGLATHNYFVHVTLRFQIRATHAY